jgi:hypothetical protein
MGLRMVASESFAEFLREQLAPLGAITMRRMFGKTGVFCDGFMLGMVRDNTLYFRVDDENRSAFREARVGSRQQGPRRVQSRSFGAKADPPISPSRGLAGLALATRRSHRCQVDICAACVGP